MRNTDEQRKKETKERRRVLGGALQAVEADVFW
jgi:hypothetical protein